MQLLIVHHDTEVGEQLAAMVQEYTEHHCGVARSGAAALNWARSASRCSLLITQLDGEGVNGLSLGGTMSEMFAGMQTMFLPAYSAAEQRLEIPHPKVFPEPIDGERQSQCGEEPNRVQDARHFGLRSRDENVAARILNHEPGKSE